MSVIADSLRGALEDHVIEEEEGEQEGEEEGEEAGEQQIGEESAKDEVAEEEEENENENENEEIGEQDAFEVELNINDRAFALFVRCCVIYSSCSRLIYLHVYLLRLVAATMFRPSLRSSVRRMTLTAAKQR